MQFEIPSGHIHADFPSQPPHFHPSYLAGRPKSDAGSEHQEISSHVSDTSSRFASQTPQPLPAYSSHPSFPYSSPHALAPSTPAMADFPSSTTGEQLYANACVPVSDAAQPHIGHYSNSSHPQELSRIDGASHKGPPPKAFPCSTCGKCFARRSDLARHERIHSGIRPHICTFENCGKQFIQRSALTVHYRVHTGEKPHMCERCGKAFSDSSSLARHRRIHSGKRPYKCPYADCQKTFTRRTTLTRHQAQHTGTVEEAAAATAAALASRVMIAKTRSELEGIYSQQGTPTHSPTYQRPMSIPPSGLSSIQAVQRQGSDMDYPSPIHSLQHLRTDGSSQSSPAGMSPLLPQHYSRSPTSMAPGPLPPTGGTMVLGSQRQPSLTSHPSTYSSSSLIETHTPSSIASAANSSTASPHISSSVSWQSPTHSLTTPTGMENYMYPESQYHPMSQSHFYYGSHNRRSLVDVEAYEPKAAPGIWAAAPTIQ